MVSEQGVQGGCRSSESFGEYRDRGLLLLPGQSPERNKKPPRGSGFREEASDTHRETSVFKPDTEEQRDSVPW